MKPLLIFYCFAVAAAFTQAPDDYPPGPDSKPQPGVPKGEVLKFSFDRVQDLPRHLPRLLGLRARAVHARQAGVPLREPGWHPVARRRPSSTT